MTSSIAIFLRSGRLGAVEVGSSESEVRKAFGCPTAEGGTSNKRKKPAVLRFDNIEVGFSFDPDPVVTYLAILGINVSCGKQHPIFADADEIALPVSDQAFRDYAAKNSITLRTAVEFGEPVYVSTCGVLIFYRAAEDGEDHDQFVEKLITAR